MKNMKEIENRIIMYIQNELKPHQYFTKEECTLENLYETFYNLYFFYEIEVEELIEKLVNKNIINEHEGKEILHNYYEKLKEKELSTPVWRDKEDDYI